MRVEILFLLFAMVFAHLSDRARADTTDAPTTARRP